MCGKFDCGSRLFSVQEILYPQIRPTLCVKPVVCARDFCVEQSSPSPGLSLSCGTFFEVVGCMQIVEWRPNYSFTGTTMACHDHQQGCLYNEAHAMSHAAAHSRKMCSSSPASSLEQQGRALGARGCFRCFAKSRPLLTALTTHTLAVAHQFPMLAFW